jgi:hypothetical protein
MDGRPFLPHVCQVEPIGTRFGDRDQVDSARKQLWPGTETFTANALEPVALHRGANLPADYQAEARRPRSVLTRWLSRNQENEMGRRHPSSGSLGSNELSMRPKPQGAAECKGHRR